jgi:hypothetical protein
MDNPPWTDYGTQPYRLELTMSKPLSAFGFEFYKDNPGSATVSYYNDTVLVHQRTATTSHGPGYGDPTLVAVRLTDASFNRVVVQTNDNALFFANMRYVLADDFRVVCDSTRLTRGNTVRCAMRAGSVIADPRWEFSNDSLDLAIPSIADTVWEGPLVISGTVVGTASLRGEQQSDSVTLAVVDRPWRALGVRMPSTLPTVHASDPSLPAVPVFQHHLGFSLMKVGVQPPEFSPRVRKIAAGPNRGLWFFGELPLEFTTWYVAINGPALRSTSAWRLTFPSGISMTSRCTRSQLDRLRGLVEQHEGTRPDTHRDSHTRVFRDVVDSVGVPMIERAVYGIRPTPDQLIAQINERADVYSRYQIDSTSRNPIQSLGCDFGLRPNP